MIHASVYILLS